MKLLISNWMADLNGRNQNTYKFALQLAILDNCNRSEIKYIDIAKYFAQKYWNNVVTYNLRESTNIDRAPYYHQSILKIAQKYCLEGLYYKHAVNKVDNLSSLIVNDIKGGYKNTLQNPISRLQTNSNTTRTGTGSAKGSGWLYSWDSSKEIISINTEITNQLYLYKDLLKKLTIFHWALFIERYNHAPSITNKLLDAKKSRSIKKLVKELVIAIANDKCFYCNESPNSVEIDHFIPFAFLFDNPIWDLVYSCRNCNSGAGGKFEKLPSPYYLNKLFERNRLMYNEDSEIFEGFNNLSDLEEYILKTYESCINAGFRKWVNESTEEKTSA